MLVEFSKISDQSKVWIYSSEKKFNTNQLAYIENKISNYLVNWQSHKKDIEAGDHHDPTYLELFCDQNPSEPECLVYDD